MVNENRRILELSLACARAKMPIAISMLADTGRGKTDTLRAFEKKFSGSVYLIPENTSSFKAQKFIRDNKDVIDVIILDDCTWIGDYDMGPWISLLKQVFDGVISKDTKSGESKKAKIGASLIMANNEKGIQGKIYEIMINTGFTDRFLPFYYTHTRETLSKIGLIYALKHPDKPEIVFQDVPTQVKAVELSKEEIFEIVETQRRSRYMRQVLSIYKVGKALDYDIDSILKFLVSMPKEMEVCFDEE